MKFDIIVGNPPYNLPKIDKKGQSNIILWDKFIINSLKFLKDNGYMSLIHPSLWRQPENKLWKILSNKQIEYLEIHSKDDCKKMFNVYSRYDWYILKNTSCMFPTIINDELRNIVKYKLNELPWLINAYNEYIFLLLAKKDDLKLDIIHSSKFFSTNLREDYGKYKIVHLINKNEIKFLYSDDNIGVGIGDKKVILCKSWNQYPINDYLGDYGLSEASFGIRISDKNEGDLMINAINSNKFKKILKYSKWTMMQTDYKMFKYFKRDFWKYFVDSNGNEI